MDDEILFDEVTYREPRKARRPDRDRRLACLAYDVPAPDDLPIFLDRAAADQIERHALSDTSVELGGILLGHECVDDETGAPFVRIVRALEAKHFENTQASFTYTHDSWEEITRERDRLFPDLDIVGWYHTHPNFGIFLSGHDLFIHRNYFARPLLVAYVVDPINQTRGFFRWRDDALEQVRGYFLTAERGDRVALARLVNDLENLPTADTGGVGGLSPRLEAELIAMLSRPATRATGPADRTQAAVFFAILGVLIGAFLMLGANWLVALNQQMAAQTAALETLKADLAETAAAQRAALDLLPGSDPKQPARDRLLARYDELKTQLDAQRTQNDLIALQVKSLNDEKTRLQAEAERAARIAEQYRADAGEAATLRARVASLEERNTRNESRIAEQDRLVDATDAMKAGDLLTRYHRAWYVAAAGWGISTLLALGLVATITRQAEARSGSPATEEAPAPGPPPHRID